MSQLVVVSPRKRETRNASNKHFEVIAGNARHCDSERGKGQGTQYKLRVDTSQHAQTHTHRRLCKTIKRGGFEAGRLFSWTR